MKSFLYSFFVFIFLSACQKEIDNTEDSQSERTLLNVAYGVDTAQRMDVYLPADRNTTDTKILILVHGGSWSSGDKRDFNSYLPVFKQQLPDYAIFNINYRLASFPANNPFPTQENDVKAAFDAIMAKAEEYNFNKEKLAVLGASAGGHLALLQAYKQNVPRVKALIDMFGPTDLKAMYAGFSTSIEQLVFQALLKGTPQSNPSLYQNSSPINFVSVQSPPTLILHGGADPLVPITQSILLREKLEAANVPVKMVVYPNEEHGWLGASLSDTYLQIESFLKIHNP